MALTGKELRDWDLTQTIFRGYKITEVDDVLEQAAQEIDRLQAENAALTARVQEHAAREAQVDEMQETLRETLLTAQQAAEDVVRSSREKAAAILADSERESCRRMDHADEQVRAAQRRVEDLQAEAVNMKTMLRRVMGDQLRLLEEDFPDLTADAAPAESSPDATQRLPLRDIRAAQSVWLEGNQLEEHGQA